jgi:hypothetical protein
MFCSRRIAGAQGQTAQPGRPFGSGPTYYTICYSETNDTIYLSAIFVTPDAAPWFDSQSHDPTNHGFTYKPLPWVTEFTQYLVQRSSYKKNGAECKNYNTSAEAQQWRDNQIQYAQNYKIQLAETGWKYAYTPVATVAPSPPATQPAAPALVAPKPSAPAATAQPAPAATRPETPYAFCWGESEKPPTPIAYFGVPFDGTVQNTPAWYKAYRTFLNNKYGMGSAGPLHCKTLKSLAEAEKARKNTEDDLRPTHKLIETGWKYP